MNEHYTLDGDAIIPGWEHTLDGDYRPKEVSHTLDGDLVYKNRITHQGEFDVRRKCGAFD